MLQINGILKHVELDHYENGCDPETSQTHSIDVLIRTETQPALLERMKDFIGWKIDELELNACDENGRINWQTMETVEGWQPTIAEMDQWKAGNLDLYLVTYSCYVEQVIEYKLV